MATKYDKKFDLDNDGVIDEKDIDMMTKAELIALCMHMGVSTKGLKFKGELKDKAKEAVSDRSVVTQTTTWVDPSDGMRKILTSDVGKVGDHKDGDVERFHANEDAPVTKNRNAKVSNLQLDLFKMQITSVASKMRKDNKATKEFQTKEEDRHVALCELCLSEGNNWKNWDEWIEKRVKADCEAFKKDGKMPEIVAPEKEEVKEDETKDAKSVNVKSPRGTNSFKNNAKKLKNLKKKKIKRWNCTWCKYTNFPGVMNCRACGRFAPGQNDLKDGQWECERCGVANPKHNQIKCFACGWMKEKPDNKEISMELKNSPIDLLGEAFGRYEINRDSSMTKVELTKFLRLLDNDLDTDNVHRIFKKLDSDDSGDISLNEFFIGAIQLAADDQTEISRSLKRMFDSMFEPDEVKAKADARKKAKVALKELTGDDDDSSDDEDDDDGNEGRQLLDSIREVFQKADTDGDGKLSEKEFVVAMNVLAVPEDHSKAAYKAVDADGSGQLDKKEFSSALLWLCAKDCADGTPDGHLAKSMQKMFIKALQRTGAVRKLGELTRQNDHDKEVKAKLGGNMEDFFKSRQTDDVMKTQRLKEMKAYHNKMRALGDGKYKDDFGDDKWAPVGDFAKDKIKAESVKVMGESYKTEEVSQGELGDCYFLTSLSVMAGRPGIVDNLMMSTKFNEQGMYKARFCKDGIWRTVDIDDRFPVEGKHLINAQPVKDEKDNGLVLWAPLLEKAWAKYHGSYANIEAGLISETLTDLTGAPSETFDTHEPDFEADLMWAKMTSFVRSGYLMGCGSGHSEMDSELFQKLGLVEDHAYAFLNAVDVPEKLAEDFRLVKLRNPWGEGEWEGAYGDTSPEMTAELKTFLKHDNIDDGSFWMAYDDFLRYYRSLTVCKIVPTWQYCALQNSFQKGAIIPNYMYLVNITKPTRVYISVIQKDKRGMPEGYKYTDLGCYVVECDGTKPHDETEYDHVGVIWPTIDRSATTEVNLTDPSRSYLIIPSQFKSDKDMDFVVTLYSANPVIVKRITPEANDVRMASHIAVESQRNSPNMKIKTFQNKKGATVPIEYMTLAVGQAIFVVINNMHEKWPFFFKMNYSKSTGLFCEREGATQTADIIPPKSRQILTVVVAKDVLAGYSWGVGFQFGFKRKMSIHHVPECPEDDLYWPISNDANDDFVEHQPGVSY